MSRFLFTLWDGGGNVAPVLDVAGALVQRGHDVRVLGDPVLAPEVDAVGARHRPWTSAPHRNHRTVEDEFVRDFEARSPLGRMARLRDRLVVGPAGAFAADTLAELRREPADVVVSEMLVLGSQIAALAAGLPNVVLVPNIYPLDVPGRPPFGMGLLPMGGPLGRLRDGALTAGSTRLWNQGLDTLNAVRAAHDQPPLTDLLDSFGEADRILVLTSEAFELGDVSSFPPNVVHCGPCLDDPAWVDEDWHPRGNEPLVLVALSTTFQEQTGMLRRAAAALGELPVRGLVTTGPSVSPEDVQAPPNVEVVESAPHAAVLRHAAAVITHSGHGTTIKALAHGVPLVCMPISRDQPDTAARVVAAGAGLRLRPGARQAAIAKAVRRVIDDPGYRESAQRLAAAIDHDVREHRAVAELELAGRGAAA